MAAKIITNARFCNLIDDYINWTDENHPRILRAGELAIVQFAPRDNGSGTAGVIGDGISTVSSLLSSDTNTFFFGQGANMNAAGSNLGGVKQGDLHKTGINIKAGIVYNDLISDWDDNENCYTISKLKVDNLIYGKATETTTFSADTITLRYIDPSTQEEPELLEDNKLAGIELRNISKDEAGDWVNAYFGMNNNMDFYVQKNGSSYIMYPSDYPYSTNTIGFYNINPETNTFSIQTPKSLTFKNDYWATGDPEDEKYEETKLRQYSGLESLEVNITPPAIIVNEQNIEYDLENNQYKIVLDAEGLTEETAALINSIPELDERITDSTESIQELAETKLDPNDVIVEGAAKITVTKTTTTETLEDETKNTTITFSIAHDEQSVEQSYAPAITVFPGNEFSFITGIETDNYGHITKIITSRYKWELGD